jgi:two-component system, LytTR family, response regulator
MKVLLIDDENDARRLLREYIADFPEFEVLEACKTGLEAIAAIDRHEPDLVFLDIQMPGASGFQVLQQIVHVPQVIFTTAYDRYALKAFDHNAVDYLLKPYTRERFRQAVGKVLASSPARNLGQVRHLAEYIGGQSPQRILVEQGNKMVALDLDHLIWVEADGDYTRLHTPQRSHLSAASMKELEERLPLERFVRIHRSAIVNIGHLKGTERDENGLYVLLSNGLKHKVSRTYVEGVKKMMV